jgi:hypothetical protein
MSSEDMPIAAKVSNVGNMPDDRAAIQNFLQIWEGDRLVKKSDAEEARQQERQKILNKIEEMFTAWRKRTDRLENQEDYNGDKELELNKGKAVKNALKELKEEVKEK